MNNYRGSVTVFMFCIVPLFIVMLAAVIWIGQVVVTRARLQSAADRAAYAGAASLADSMNHIAEANWKIHKSYRDLEHDFQTDTQQNPDAARQRFERYEAERDEQEEFMNRIKSEMRQRAEGIATSLLGANFPGAEGLMLVQEDLSISSDEEFQWGDPAYSHVTGSFVDPEDVDGGEYRALKFLTKRRGYGQSIGVIARVNINPLILRSIMGNELRVEAAAAAKAYGGSIENFARKETDSVEDAEAMISEDGVDHLYRAAIVPVWTMGVDEAN